MTTIPVWTQVDQLKAKCDAELAQTKSALHDLSRSWRLLEPSDEYWWRASHRTKGSVHAKTSAELLAKCKALMGEVKS